jgi:acetoacetate decarboxylase
LGNAVCFGIRNVEDADAKALVGKIKGEGAWTGPGALDLHAHALAPVAELPVREVISATHIIADLTLGLGKVIYDYLDPKIAAKIGAQDAA